MESPSRKAGRHGAFKVLIAGGSVAGLALALILEAYDIDYLLLEKHSQIAPFLGTTVGINPNGARILDQLGVYGSLDKLGGKQHTNFYYDPEGKLLAVQEPIDDSMRWLFGYDFCFLNRQDLLRALYNAAKHKSKIKTATEIADIVEHESQVKVITRDGSEFQGDILVGADGVHSRVRRELWRIAEETLPECITQHDKNAVQSTYSCMTGISPCPPGLTDRQASRCMNYNRSYVVLTQPGAELCWWLAFFKHDQTLSEGDIPRYTVDDHKDILDKYGSDKVGETTLSQLYKSAHHKVLVPIEEFTLDKWFLGRVVLLGDSCHKVHPIIGQGANQAIESAACLADLLRCLVHGDISRTSDDAAIHAIFSRYHSTRHPRAVSVMNAGRFSQCVDSLDTRWFKLFAFYVGTKTPIQDGFLPSFANLVLPAVSLRGLPQPDHGGNMAYEDQIRINPSPRSKRDTLSFVSIVVLLSSLSFYVGAMLKARSYSSGAYGEPSFYSGAQRIAINSVWIVESYRASAALTPLMSALPFITLATLINNWQITLAIYCILHIRHSSSRDFYYPNPRAINTKVAASLPLAALIAYVFPAIYRFYLSSIHYNHTQCLGDTWRFSHFVFPLVVYIQGTVVQILPTTTKLRAGTEADAARLKIITSFSSAHDIPYLLRYYVIIFLLASVAHLSAAAAALVDGKSAGLGEWVTLAPIALGLSVFTAWDLKRVNIWNGSVIWASVCVLLTLGFVGPGAVLIGLWTWRERRIEEGRRHEN